SNRDWSSDVCSSDLFQTYAINVNWLVSTRLLIAGFLLLVIQYSLKEKRQVFDIWQQKRTAFQLVIFGLLGMLAVQYTYMASIERSEERREGKDCRYG